MPASTPCHQALAAQALARHRFLSLPQLMVSHLPTASRIAQLAGGAALGLLLRSPAALRWVQRRRLRTRHTAVGWLHVLHVPGFGTPAVQATLSRRARLLRPSGPSSAGAPWQQQQRLPCRLPWRSSCCGGPCCSGPQAAHPGRCAMLACTSRCCPAEGRLGLRHPACVDGCMPTLCTRQRRGCWRHAPGGRLLELSNNQYLLHEQARLCVLLALPAGAATLHPGAAPGGPGVGVGGHAGRWLRCRAGHARTSAAAAPATLGDGSCSLKCEAPADTG